MPKGRRSMGKLPHRAGFSALAHGEAHGARRRRWRHNELARVQVLPLVPYFLPRTLEGDEAELTRVANPPPLSALD